jgi:hypothetical protein
MAAFKTKRVTLEWHLLKLVIPAQAGIQVVYSPLDSRLRGNDALRDSALSH